MIKKIIHYIPDFFCLVIIEGIIWGFIHSITRVIFLKYLFDMFEKRVPFSEILYIVLAMMLFLSLSHLFSFWFWNKYEPKARLRLHEKMQNMLFEKARKTDLSCYDDTEYYNDFVWAMQEADSRAISVMEDLGKFINRTVSIITIIGMLLTINFFLVLLIVCTVLFSVFIDTIKIKINYKKASDMKPLFRKNSYINRVFYLPDYSKEMRLTKLLNVLEKEYDNTVKDIKNVHRRYSKKFFILNSINELISSTILESGVPIVLTYMLMVMKSLTLGEFASTINAVTKLFWSFKGLLGYLVNFEEHSLYAEKFCKFLNYQNQVKDSIEALPIINSISTIQLDDVSYQYKNSSKLALENLNLLIRAGQKIAFVGYNGAGKSTLVKILMRLYDVSSGEIRINNNAITYYTLSSYRKKFNTVFQDYQVFAASIAENVLMSPYNKDKEDIVLSALRCAGFEKKLNNFPLGVNSQLTKEFDSNGINLSGGEMQKIAIARVFASPCDIIILDEPSSALDPISEYELNQIIAEAAKDKTIIYISHRLSSTKMADKIYMLENGKIIEEGTHDELIKINGKYAEMFTLQAKKYRYEAM